ncbi:hypothetical protein CUJ84_Chr003658 [Rhizobium leguminosarum]|uniref:Uncharacterized protein n=1 Tax=Rhizobium leguminosarum TaxID=384 RepID=A0A2K9Z6Y2_RHILE|nr:hypothetical protein CUJ84_Chr003658 [Rhizobium leguminosarum]
MFHVVGKQHRSHDQREGNRQQQPEDNGNPRFSHRLFRICGRRIVGQAYLLRRARRVSIGLSRAFPFFSKPRNPLSFCFCAIPDANRCALLLELLQIQHIHSAVKYLWLRVGNWAPLCRVIRQGALQISAEAFQSDVNLESPI